jgi:hypothetical protein
MGYILGTWLGAMQTNLWSLTNLLPWSRICFMGIGKGKLNWFDPDFRINYGNWDGCDWLFAFHFLLGVFWKVKCFNQKWLHHHQLKSYSKDLLWHYSPWRNSKYAKTLLRCSSQSIISMFAANQWRQALRSKGGFFLRLLVNGSSNKSC